MQDRDFEEVYLLQLSTVQIQDSSAEAKTADEVTLGQLLVEAAIQCPEADALIGDFGSVSYSDLLIQAQNIAVVLKRHGVGPGHTVGVAIQPSPLMLASIAGTVLAGAAYVQLTPAMQAAAVLKTVGIALVLFDGSAQCAEIIRPWKGLAKLLDASRMEQETMPLSHDTRVDPFPASATAVFVLNDNDRGELNPVRASHCTVANLSRAGELSTRQMKYGAGDVFLLHGTNQNRSGIFEIWSSLLHGASLAIEPTPALAPQEFARWVQRLGVSVLCLSVKRVCEFMDGDAGLFTNLRHLIIESDDTSGTISPQRVEQLLQRHFHTLHIVQVFSTPGIAGYASAYHVPAHYLAQSDLPIGLPLPGLQAGILDAALQPVRTGEIGELVFKDIEMSDGEPCRTGVRARLRADGLLELHGRVEALRLMRPAAIEVEAIDEEGTCLDLAGPPDEAMNAHRFSVSTSRQMNSTRIEDIVPFAR